MPEVPNPQRFFVEVAPYDAITITKDDWEAVLTLQFFDGTIDAHCPKCTRDSVFQSAPSMPTLRSGGGSRETAKSLSRVLSEYRAWFPYWGESREFESKDYSVAFRRWENVFHCTRCSATDLVFYVEVKNGVLRKVGQVPPLIDLHLPELQKYRPALAPEKYAELVRGVGLATHGVGIGAFVYLRRVFEDLVEGAHAAASQDDGWDEDEYVRSRMDEKIRLLSGRLPDFLVENRKLYSILSLGVHELSEEDCLQHFPVVRAGIELILDERLEARTKAEKMKKAAADVATLKGKLTP